MGRTATSEERRKVLELIKKIQGLEDRDIIYARPTFVADTKYFTCRIDYAVHKGGGYQVFEGDLYIDSVQASTAVLGKGRVTPRRPTVYTKPVKTKKQMDEEREQVRVEMQYGTTLDDERIA